MLPEFLLTETTVREAGTGPEVALGEQQGGTLVLTLGITRIIEQESIDLSIWGLPTAPIGATKPWPPSRRSSIAAPTRSLPIFPATRTCSFCA